MSTPAARPGRLQRVFLDIARSKDRERALAQPVRVRRRPFLFVLSLMLAFMLVPTLVCGQLQGPPGGVPIPTAPVASGTGRGSTAAGADPDSRVFRVRLVDGHNGTSVANGRIQLWYDEASGSPYTLTTNTDGLALMPQPVGMPVRVLLSSADHVDCRKSSAHEPQTGFNLGAIEKQGASTENRCGQIHLKPGPGELIFYVRPIRWYEGLNRP